MYYHHLKQFIYLFIITPLHTDNVAFSFRNYLIEFIYILMQKVPARITNIASYTSVEIEHKCCKSK